MQDIPNKKGYYSKYDVLKTEEGVSLLRVIERQSVFQKYVKYWVMDGDNKAYYQSKIDGLRAFNKAVKAKFENQT